MFCAPYLGGWVWDYAMLLIFPVHIVSHTLFPQINVCSENETKIACLEDCAESYLSSVGCATSCYCLIQYTRVSTLSYITCCGDVCHKDSFRMFQCHSPVGWPQLLVGGVVLVKVRQGISRLCWCLLRNHLLLKRTQGSQPGALDLLTPTPPVLKMDAAHRDWPANISAWYHICMSKRACGDIILVWNRWNWFNTLIKCKV